MDFISKTFLIILVILGNVPSLSAIENSKDLMAALNAAIAAKDLNAASKLVEWGQAPVMAHRMLKMNIIDCYPPAKCKLELEALSEEEKKPNSEYKFVANPEGKLKIVPPDGNGDFSMPYAKVGQEYKFVIGQQTEGAYAQAKASADARKIAQDMDADLLSSGQALPADGGQPFAAFNQYLEAISKGDTGYLAEHGTSGDRYFFGKAYKDNPAKAALTLELVRLEALNKPTIKGGFIKDNRAILLVSGVSGQGWVTEGAVTLTQYSGKWSVEDKNYISYPSKLG